MFVVTQRQSFDADPGRHARRSRHRGLNQLALRPGAVAQRQQRHARALEIRSDVGHPADQPHAVAHRAVRADHVRCQLVADDGDGVPFEHARGKTRNDVVRQEAERVDVRRVTEIPEEEQSAAIAEADRGLREFLGIRHGDREIRSPEVFVDDVRLALRNREDAVGGGVRVQLTRHLAREAGVEHVDAIAGVATAIEPPRLTQEVQVDRIDEHARPRRVPADQRQVAFADPPEMEDRQVESARCGERGRIDERVGSTCRGFRSRIDGDAHLLQQRPIRFVAVRAFGDNISKFADCFPDNFAHQSVVFHNQNSHLIIQCSASY